MKYLGIDVGGMGIKTCVMDKTGNIYKSDSTPTDSNWTNIEFIKIVKKIIQSYQSEFELSGIGIGTPGPIDIDLGIILQSANLKKISNLSILTELKKDISIPIHFNNDANAAAIGEYMFGNGRNCPNLIVLTLGTGLGCGWILNGQLYNGYKGNGMESGHLTIVKDGSICGCGQKGCAESYFSTIGFLNRYKEKTQISLSSAKDFFEKVESNDLVAIEVLNYATEVLAELIRNLVHSINPQKVLLIGGIIGSSHLFFKNLVEKIQNIIFPVFQDYVKVELGKNLSGAQGACALSIL